jgi:hypothetical protein
MDHQALAQLLGNYGEFVGAIAVVATLGYLAVQIRHSTNTIGGSTEMQLAREMAAWHARVTGDAELREIYEMAASDEPMEDAQRQRYCWLISELFFLYEGVYRQYRRGLMSEVAWQTLVDTMIGLLRNPEANRWWTSRAPAFSDEFFEYVEEKRKSRAEEASWRQRGALG